jgi:phosphate starvation-inducible PhoH-like protein
VTHAKGVLESLYVQARRGRNLGTGDVDGAIEETALQKNLFPGDKAKAPTEMREPGAGGFGFVATRKKGPVKARNAAQDLYLRILQRHELVFAEGPAGTGKTWLAVGHAVQLLEAGHVERLVLSRPAVEAGEKIGFLPGDMRDKVDPYLRPIYDALYDFMESRLVERALQTGVIEVAPLAFMRGRTLSNALVLLDEAQNTSSMQMKMFLTRLGEGSRMIITGDPTQIDLPPGQTSGFGEAVRLLEGVEGIGHVKFGHQHVVRHDLVRRIVQAYEEKGTPPRSTPA